MASKRLCPACAQPFIKGKRVLFAARTGPRMATVCTACFAGGLVIVQDKTGELERCTDCEKNPACLCMACVQTRSNSAVKLFASRRPA